MWLRNLNTMPLVKRGGGAMIKMNKEVQKIYDDAVANSYYFENKNAYWTGYFIGKVNMAVTDEDIDKYFEKVQIASQKLYDKQLEVA